jgi:hypothetical protein
LLKPSQQRRKETAVHRAAGDRLGAINAYMTTSVEERTIDLVVR